MPPSRRRRGERALDRLAAHNKSPERSNNGKDGNKKNKKNPKEKPKEKPRDKEKTLNQQQDDATQQELRSLREEVARYKAEEEKRRNTGTQEGIQQQHLNGGQQQMQQGNQQLLQQGPQASQGQVQPDIQLLHVQQQLNQAGAAGVMGQGTGEGLQVQGVMQYPYNLGLPNGPVEVSCNRVETSSILPSVPLEVKKKIWGNQFVPLETLLRTEEADVEDGKMLLVFDPNNANNPMSLSKKKSPKITNLQQWIKGYQALMLVMLENNPNRAKELIGYQCIIMDAAAKFPMHQWLQYDEKFRKSTAGIPTKRWDVVDVQLWVVTFTWAPRASCNLCQSPNHWAKDCPAKTKGHFNSTNPKGGRPNFRSCYDFNKPRGCNRDHCRFSHKCSKCGRDGHSIFECSGTPSHGMN
ncbi:uncharacterized protein LOC118417400 [Branchiostoma floridae]|uniref:Uncharacterized protein LOC118417400 n=1 Tax=Branchiostoma floridae TaxID=7739 RepID=A0A9J7LB22_BRAFL|nr:uncharacterized protein LOC118417400 [Branchiostoma floridae]